jgi:hypothetical protein
MANIGRRQRVYSRSAGYRSVIASSLLKCREFTIFTTLPVDGINKKLEKVEIEREIYFEECVTPLVERAEERQTNRLFRPSAAERGDVAKKKFMKSC